jgi:hypothetical protein
MFRHSRRIVSILFVAVVAGTAGSAHRLAAAAQDGPCYWIGTIWYCEGP